MLEECTGRSPTGYLYGAAISLPSIIIRLRRKFAAGPLNLKFMGINGILRSLTPNWRRQLPHQALETTLVTGTGFVENGREL